MYGAIASNISPTPLYLRQAVRPTRPPGRQTLASSRATRAWSGAKITPTDDETTSNDASSYGRFWQSATSSVRSRPSSAARRSCGLDERPARDPSRSRSRPHAAARNATSPAPQPRSSHCSPGLGARRSTSAYVHLADQLARCSRTGPSPTSRLAGLSAPRMPWLHSFRLGGQRPRLSMSRYAQSVSWLCGSVTPSG